ncbi:MAG: hypothetical protein RR370_00940 [Synergistaceae bacterium]
MSAGGIVMDFSSMKVPHPWAIYDGWNPDVVLALVILGFLSYKIYKKYDSSLKRQRATTQNGGSYSYHLDYTTRRKF